MFNKIILETPCPYLLTASHAIATFIGCQLSHLDQNRTHIQLQSHIKLLCFSLLYTVNVGISNASLGLVTLPVHQAIRATSPVLTALLALVIPAASTQKPRGFKSCRILLPIVAGVLLATHSGRYDATPYGLVLTLIGALLAVVKTIATNVLLRDNQLDLHPMELLRILSPYAGAQALSWAIWNGEHEIFRNAVRKDIWLALKLLVNAAMAALLNFTSFEANKQCGPLAMAVTANLKQVILLALPLTGQIPSKQVVLGTLMTVGGSIWYASAQMEDGRRKTPSIQSILPEHLATQQK